MAPAALQLHIFFFPFMAHGHMMPMIDIAKLFAARGVRVTLILTPLNASLFQSTINRSKAAGHPIEIHLLEFPSSQTGLAEGSENLDYITNPFEAIRFYKAIEMFEKPFEQLVEEHLPDAIVSDMYLPWTAEVARRFDISRVIFNGSGYFSLCCLDSIRRFSPDKCVESDATAFILPGLPHPIEMTKTQLPDLTKTPAEFAQLWQKIGKAESMSYGVVMNSFYELEPAYVEHFKNKLGKKTWQIGPVSLCNRETVEKADRGKKASILTEECSNWLNGKEPNSVLYICFGSRCNFTTPQLAEIAEALESSGCPFIWVVKESQTLPEGFEGRTKEKGLVITGWAPQMIILEHPALGGFMTHCGWNSVLEGISSGLPMITWPAFAEQFYNEKLVTDVLKIGVGVGSRQWLMWGEEKRLVVKKQAIEDAVRRVMGVGEEAKAMREKARELGETARKAVEVGGSSYHDLSHLIEELKLISSRS
ncbi:scopoletin glucosyltransferase-like [Aristolochia californica]|uniref:scopoletin glucosyltransferase-like n=1 Tax=Aristolochia californica TaxID=171875 RepID=UPI0035DEDDCE